ncbi:GtrA family protein [Nocardia caishijiensis]|uniref:GtrA-like protein n=1 Tax=Nocardia caishijiensis TaxID=184756 RepID=A0ABQ6YSF9_9NOCA|nr:GtrA family protein [Nocardia caishijiensis]KAF0848729.1 GtrA-like protein [Nocardia caishijiensis]
MNSIAIAPVVGPLVVPAPDWSRLYAWARRFALGDHPLAQLLRFAVVGGTSNIAYLLLFTACADLGPLTANIAGSVVSTAIANELHRRLTFRTTAVPWFTAQCQGTGLALIGLGITTAALATLDSLAPTLGNLTQATTMLAIMATVGLARFLILRSLIG